MLCRGTRGRRSWSVLSLKPNKRRPPRPVPVLTTAQEALLSAIADSKQLTPDAVLARHDAVRPVPQLTPGQVAFHGGLTANPAAFSLEKVAGKTVPALLGGGDNAALHAAGEELDAVLEAERRKRNDLLATLLHAPRGEPL